MATDSGPITSARKRELRHGLPVTVGEFRLEEDRFVRLRDNGEVRSEVTTEGLSLAIVERRDLGVMWFLLVLSGAILGGLYAVGGLYGASAAVCPVLGLVFLAFMAFLKSDKLEVTTSARTEIWGINDDSNSLELQILIARVNGVLRPSSGSKTP